MKIHHFKTYLEKTRKDILTSDIGTETQLKNETTVKE